MAQHKTQLTPLIVRVYIIAKGELLKESAGDSVY